LYYNLGAKIILNPFKTRELDHYNGEHDENCFQI